MNKLKYSILLVFLPFLGFSQTNLIQGNVKDKVGEPIPGVTILVKGTSIGTTTDIDGNFVIDTKDQKLGIIKFSYLGFSNKEIRFNENLKEIDVILDESIEQLDAVVITALGIKRERKSLAYSTQKIQTEDLTEARSTNVLNALSGKASGVQVVNSSTPTGTTRVIIRGLTSITGDNQPLYVIDGIPLDSSPGDGGVSVWNSGDDIDLGSPLSTINPDDIESIQVLKGANASALYGSRASNGVVLITSKTANKKNGAKLKVFINSNLSVISNREYPYYQYVYGAGDQGRTVTAGRPVDSETGLPAVGNYLRAYGMPFLGQQILNYNGTVGTYKPNTNNVKELYKVGTVATTSFAFSRAGEKSTFRFSYANTMGDHVIDRMEKINRNNVAFRFSRNITEGLNVSANLRYVNQLVTNRLYQNGSNRNPASNYIWMLPNMSRANLNPYKDENNNAFVYRGEFNNPYWNIYENSNQDDLNRVVGNLTLDWNITKGLSLRSRINGAVNKIDRYEFNNLGAAYDPNGLYREVNINRENWNYEAILNYSTKIKNISLVTLLGVNKFDLRTSGKRVTAISIKERDIKNSSNGDEFLPTLYLPNNKTINSIFSSISIGLKDTYYLDITGRNDWSSTLPSSNNSYFYPSIGATTVFTNLLPSSSFINYGKVRASYAQVGSDTSFDRLVNNFIEGGTYNQTQWFALQSQRNNPTLKPEMTTSKEFGIELELLNKRVSLDATVYRSATNDQIIPVRVTPTSGFISKFINAGEIQNDGIELFLSAKIFDKQFKWKTDLNWSKNESKVISLTPGTDRLLLRNWFNVGVFAEVGQPFGNIRGNAPARDAETKTPLVFPNGRIRWDNDQLLGNAQPDWIGSVRNAFSYKGLSLNVLVDVKMGGDLFSASMVKSSNYGIHAETLAGREAYLFSSMILGENNNERAGNGLFGNPYGDSERPKGRTYENSAVGVQDADGNWVAQRDSDGNIIYANIWLSPQLYGFDGIQDQTRFVYDASYVKLREVVFGYTFPPRILKKLKNIKHLKVSLVGRDLWTIYRNTPQGIDPEAGTTSGNGQGIEFGSFLPTRTVGVNVKIAF